MRIERARTTKDVDLRVVGAPEDVLDRLREAAGRDLDDFMVFSIRPDDHHPDIRNEGIQYEGLRFRAECTLAGKIYGRPFGVDVAFGDPIWGEPELIMAEDSLAFAGIAPPQLRVYPVETHLAEKLHAYTMPRTRPNSRIKDLPDISLIATAGRIEAARVRAAIEQTFAFRNTHSVPKRLPEPPETWEAPYAVIAREEKLRWVTLDDVFEAARAFLEPVLTESDNAVWDPDAWRWATTGVRGSPEEQA